jgi:hypothetical protein
VKSAIQKIYKAIAWVVGILLFCCFLFVITQSVQNTVLIQAINKVLAQTEESRYLGEKIPGRSALGNWYQVCDARGNPEGKALFFSIMDNGILIPCLAFTSGDGIDILPLNNHAKAVFKYIPQGVIDMYLRRIEKEVLP